MTRRRTIDTAGESITNQRAEHVFQTNSAVQRGDIDQDGRAVDVVVDQDMRDDELIDHLNEPDNWDLDKEWAVTSPNWNPQRHTLLTARRVARAQLFEFGRPRTL